jgi:CheY-like chemotaxis protein
MRVLLAEDNSVNQMLAMRLLQKRGHSVTVVDNGREALDALAKGSFDLVLMDVQMPEMDGIEATTALREREKPTGGHQPVVALTALVIKGDKQRCLDAGMDGYLSKPIRQQELDEILEKFSPRLSPIETDGASEKNREPDLLRLPVALLLPQTPYERLHNVSLNEVELMDRIGGDLEFLAELTEIFRKEYPRQLSAARKAVKDRDREALRQAGHALRGALANLAASDIAALAGEIEGIADDSDPADAGILVDEIEQEIKSVLRSLESLCQETAG